MSQVGKCDSGMRCDTNFATNLGLTKETTEMTQMCEQLGKIKMKGPNSEEGGTEEDLMNYVEGQKQRPTLVTMRITIKVVGDTTTCEHFNQEKGSMSGRPLLSYLQ